MRNWLVASGASLVFSAALIAITLPFAAFMYFGHLERNPEWVSGFLMCLYIVGLGALLYLWSKRSDRHAAEERRVEDEKRRAWFEGATK